MEKDTNEKSLVVFQDNFLTKVKKFFSRFFFGRDEEVEYDETENKENENNKTEVIGIYEEPEQKEWRLYNFDADNTEEWPEPKEVPNGQENGEQSDDVDYEQEPVSQVCKEKEELEQKLKNYYASITNMHN